MNIDSAVIGYVASGFTMVSFFPQALHTWKTKRTKDISLPMYIATVTSMVLWLVFGLMIQESPIILTNCVSLCFALPILLLKLKHG